TSTCSFTVTVEDNEAPEITCVGNQTPAPDVACTYTHSGTSWDAVVTDNTGATLVEGFSDTYNWSATASSGSTAISYVTVENEKLLRLAYNGDGLPRNGTYVFSTIAENTETISFDWSLSGCHSWFQAVANYGLWVGNTANIVQNLYTGAGTCGFNASGSSNFAV